MLPNQAEHLKPQDTLLKMNSYIQLIKMNSCKLYIL